jgi:hypothetical protein
MRAPWRAERCRLQAMRQRGLQRVPGNLDALAVGQCLSQRLGDALATTGLQFGSHLEPQELLQHHFASDTGLPEQHVCRLRQAPRGFDRQQAPGTQPPQPDLGDIGVAGAQPMHRRHDVIHPLGPRRVAEFAFAVAAAVEIGHQDRRTVGSERAGLHGHHAARLVHLFCKSVHVHHEHLRCVWGLVQQRKPATRCHAEVKAPQTAHCH